MQREYILTITVVSIIVLEVIFLKCILPWIIKRRAYNKKCREYKKKYMDWRERALKAVKENEYGQ